jgi:putative endonuclease
LFLPAGRQVMYNKKFSKEPTDKQKLGELGETFACNYLKNNGYVVLERNYLKKWGEIDVVAKKSNRIHFVEVKSVTRNLSGSEVSQDFDSYRPEDNMHPLKLKRLGRAIQSYLLERDIPDDMDWQFDVAMIYIDLNKSLHHVLLLEDVVL